jgi:hypothetical protein
MTRRARSVGTVLLGFALAVAGSASADGDRYPGGTASLASEPRRVRTYCLSLPSENGHLRARCSVTLERITLPDISRSERAIVALPAHAAELLAAKCPELVGPPTLASQATTERERVFFEDGARACVAKDAQALVRSFIGFARDVEEHTCHLESSLTESVDFDQVDANTWVAHRGPSDSECGATVVDTIWRDAGDTVGWNYKSVVIYSPTATRSCASEAGKTDVYDYRWRNVKTRDLGCRYFDL